MRAIATAILVMLAVGLAACGGGDDPTPSPTASMTGTPTPATAAGPLTSIRDAPFEDPALVGPLIDAAGGGQVPVERVEFHDLIGNDGVEEAVAIVESGGTMGDLGAGIFALDDGHARLVQFIPVAGRIEVRFDLVVAIEGVWADGDPQCCPSRLRETSYQWDGARFVAITEQVVPNEDR
jgi:hypothetical protein